MGECRPLANAIGASSTRGTRFIWCVGLALAVSTSAIAVSPPPTYAQALELIHAYNGAGDELQRAMQLAEALSKSHPRSGYAETLLAEALSTWELDQNGEPLQLRVEIIGMADEALRLNPGLAEAHVAKARALVRASAYKQANTTIDAAFSLNPSLSGAMFQRAEIFRRTGELSAAEVWYRKFIEATPSNPRKSNAYSWMAQMYDDAGRNDPANRQVLAGKARESYERGLALDPDGVWKNVNFAIFLNDYVGDFDAAERYALKALGLMEFPMARYHLAAARYQKIWVSLRSTQRPPHAQAVNDVEASTRVSLDEAIAFRTFSSVVRGRLQELRASLQRGK